MEEDRNEPAVFFCFTRMTIDTDEIKKPAGYGVAGVAAGCVLSMLTGPGAALTLTAIGVLGVLGVTQYRKQRGNNNSNGSNENKQNNEKGE